MIVVVRAVDGLLGRRLEELQIVALGVLERRNATPWVVADLADELHTGVERIAPLVPYLDDGRIFIFASKGGADTNPDWFHNLVAHPETTVEFGTDTFPVTARVLTGDERDDVYAKQSQVEAQFAEYQRNTTRVIPVLELERAAS